MSNPSDDVKYPVYFNNTRASKIGEASTSDEAKLIILSRYRMMDAQDDWIQDSVSLNHVAFDFSRKLFYGIWA